MVEIMDYKCMVRIVPATCTPEQYTKSVTLWVVTGIAGFLFWLAAIVVPPVILAIYTPSLIGVSGFWGFLVGALCYVWASDWLDGRPHRMK